MAYILLLFHGIILIMYHLTDGFVMHIFWVKETVCSALATLVTQFGSGKTG